MGADQSNEIRKQAQVAAYNAMESGNLLADRYIEIMPSLAEAVARPLSAVDSITLYGEGNSAAMVGDTSRTVSQLSSALGDVLGIDLKDVVGGLVTGAAAGNACGVCDVGNRWRKGRRCARLGTPSLDARIAEPRTSL